jgi:hypothetical protein
MTEFTAPERQQRRRNRLLLVLFAALALAFALYPSVCTYVEQPQRYFHSYAQAPRGGPDALPPLVPGSATEIHTRRDARGGLYWVRFNFPPAEHAHVVAGLRRLPRGEATVLHIDEPTFTPWWTVNERTMLGRAGNRLEVYADPAGHAWLFVDPASSNAFYWRRDG